MHITRWGGKVVTRPLINMTTTEDLLSRTHYPTQAQQIKLHRGLQFQEKGGIGRQLLR